MIKEEKDCGLKLIRARDINHHFIKRDHHDLVKKLLKDFKSVYYITLICLSVLSLLLVCFLVASLILLEHWYVDLFFMVSSLICLFLLNKTYSKYKLLCPIKLFNSQYGKVYSIYRPNTVDKKGRPLLNLLKFPKMIDVELDSYFDKSLGKMILEGALLKGVLSYNCKLKDGDDVLIICLPDGRCYAVKLENK